MRHQGPERLSIGVEVGLAVRREHEDAFAVWADNARVFFRIGFNPFRGVIHHAVFPSGEPQQDQAEFFGACAFNDAIEFLEIELSRLRLDRLPIHGHFDGVDVQGL